MKVQIEKSVACGSLTAPPSKSAAHRAIICAGLADGQSIIKNISFSDDIVATLNAVKAFGADVKITDDRAIINGCGGHIKECEINCNESGSTLRFLIPICLLNENTSVLYGSEKLFSRPLSIYENICKAQKLFYEKGSNYLKASGCLKPDRFLIRGDISSQFFTGLLFALPLLENDSVIEIIPPLESKSYIDITLSILTKFGIEADFSDLIIKIKGNQKYKPCDITVEGDYSNAAFLDAFNYVGGSFELKGLSEESFQGDRVYKGIFEKLDKGFSEIDIADCPDLAPVIIALASVKNGAVLLNTRRLKMKESDRGEAMKEELRKFGINIITEENKITVPKCTLKKPCEVLHSHNDHRIAMALSVVCSLCGGVIENAEAVKKSFPDFWNEIKRIGIKVKSYV